VSKLIIDVTNHQFDVSLGTIKNSWCHNVHSSGRCLPEKGPCCRNRLNLSPTSAVRKPLFSLKNSETSIFLQGPAAAVQMRATHDPTGPPMRCTNQVTGPRCVEVPGVRKQPRAVNSAHSRAESTSTASVTPAMRPGRRCRKLSMAVPRCLTSASISATRSLIRRLPQARPSPANRLRSKTLRNSHCRWDSLKSSARLESHRANATPYAGGKQAEEGMGQVRLGQGSTVLTLTAAVRNFSVLRKRLGDVNHSSDGGCVSSKRVCIKRKDPSAEVNGDISSSTGCRVWIARWSSLSRRTRDRVRSAGGSPT
jgi:hypothetical protein